MTLEDLPVHRQEALLWRYALELDYDGVDALVRSADPRACMSALSRRTNQNWGQPSLVTTADFTFVLMAGSCVLKPPCRDRPGVMRHAVSYQWWTDGRSYRCQWPPIRDGVSSIGDVHRATVRWTVTLTGTVDAPELMPVRQRCVPGLYWPPHLDSSSPVRRVRSKVVEALGWRCNGCGRRGEFVDHDHFTGMVRGFLCKHCNTHIDRCLHVAGCPWAEYLNNPPAAGLRLYHPKADRARTKPSSLAASSIWGSIRSSGVVGTAEGHVPVPGRIRRIFFPAARSCTQVIRTGAERRGAADAIREAPGYSFTPSRPRRG